MDYKYIEQLMERYWQGETTLQEEAILRAFFSQEEVPTALKRYKALFAGAMEQQEEPLGDDFDARMLALTGDDEAPKARAVTLTSRLMPLFKAAAIVAIVLTIGNAAQAPWDRSWDDAQANHAAIAVQKVDSVNVLGTIQAENMADSTKAVTKETSTYYE